MRHKDVCIGLANEVKTANTGFEKLKSLLPDRSDWESESQAHSSDIFYPPPFSHANALCSAPTPMDGNSRLRTRVLILGLDLSRHRHRGADYSSGSDVCGTLLDCGSRHAHGLYRNRAQDSIFFKADRVVRGGWSVAADGRQPHALVRGTCGLVGPGCIDHRHHPAVVSGARFSSARRPSHFGTRKRRASSRNRGTVRAGVAAIAVRNARTP